MKLLSVNNKMKKSSKGKYKVMNFTLPAWKTKTGERTCPNAKNCITGCYARQGAYIWNNVAAKHEKNYFASKHDLFSKYIIDELNSMRTLPTHIRIHDSGDFYSKEYFEKWLYVAMVFPNIQFYAYTKMISLVKSYESLPKNFTIIFSYGGKEDSLINPITDRHSWVYENKEILDASGYIDASHNDLLALTDNIRVGLSYHGAKSYKNTTWNNLVKENNNNSCSAA